MSNPARNVCPIKFYLEKNINFAKKQMYYENYNHIPTA